MLQKLLKFLKWICILICILVGLAMLGMGVYFMIKPLPFNKSTVAEVKQVTCDDKCRVKLQYYVNEQPFVKDAVLKKKVSVGDEITILYNDINPNVFYPGNPPIKLLANILITVGISISVSFILWSVILYKNRNTDDVASDGGQPQVEAKPWF